MTKRKYSDIYKININDTFQAKKPKLEINRKRKSNDDDLEDDELEEYKFINKRKQKYIEEIKQDNVNDEQYNLDNCDFDKKTFFNMSCRNTINVVSSNMIYCYVN